MNVLEALVTAKFTTFTLKPFPKGMLYMPKLAGLRLEVGIPLNPPFQGGLLENLAFPF
jgi:hypothetical protein